MVNSIRHVRDQGELRSIIASRLQELDEFVAHEFNQLADLVTKLKEENSTLRTQCEVQCFSAISPFRTKEEAEPLRTSTNSSTYQLIGDHVAIESTFGQSLQGRDLETKSLRAWNMTSMQMPLEEIVPLNPSTRVSTLSTNEEHEELVHENNGNLGPMGSARPSIKSCQPAGDHRPLAAEANDTIMDERAKEGSTYDQFDEGTMRDADSCSIQHIQLTEKYHERQSSDLSAATPKFHLAAMEPSRNSAQPMSTRHARKHQSHTRFFELMPMFKIQEEEEMEQRGSLTMPPMTTGVTQTDKNFKKAVQRLSEMERRKRGHMNRCAFFSKLQPLVMSPTSRPAIAFDVVAVILIVYDCIAVPLLLLQTSIATHFYFVQLMFWISRIFWTIAIPRTFITGYMKQDGAIENDPILLSRKYFQTWFAFDVLIVLADWLDLALDAGAGVVRIIRLLKAARLARMFRVPNRIIRQFNHAKSDRMLSWLSIIKSTITFFLVNHFLACIWYWIGSVSDAKGWVKDFDLKDADIATKYTYAVHWSASQFIGSTEVMPRSESERVFGAFVMIFAFIWSASFISNITAAMTRLQILSSQKSTLFSSLRQFLANNHVTEELAYRVLTSAKFMVKESEKNQGETDIKLLHMLSQPMLNEIHYEMHSGHLIQHPFFWHYNQVEYLALQKLCHSAITIHTIGTADVLFAQGEEPTDPRMFFVISGTLLYIKDFDGDGNVDAEEMVEVTNPMWVCEPVLWMKWTHVGNLRAAMHCSVLALSAERFRQVVSEYRNTPYPAQYAAQLVEMMNLAMKSDEVDDLGTHIDVKEIVRRVFPMEFQKISSSRSRMFTRSLSNLNPGFFKRGLF